MKPRATRWRSLIVKKKNGPKPMLPKRGEIWQVDFGFLGKVRPAVLVSVSYDDVDRALFAFVPHTTQVRGSRFEIDVVVPRLAAGTFLVQSLTSVSRRAVLRRLGKLEPDQMQAVENGLRDWLGL